MSVCKYCGVELEYDKNTVCGACLSKIRSNCRKGKHFDYGVYSIERWEDCIADIDTAKKAYESARFLIDHFGGITEVDQLNEFASKVESYLVCVRDNQLDGDSLLKSPIWKQRGERFVKGVIERYYELRLSNYGAEGFWERYSLIYEPLESYLPNTSLLSQIILHCKNSPKCKDPMGFKKLMEAQLSLAIVNDFEKHKNKCL